MCPQPPAAPGSTNGGSVSEPPRLGPSWKAEPGLGVGGPGLVFVSGENTSKSLWGSSLRVLATCRRCGARRGKDAVPAQRLRRPSLGSENSSTPSSWVTNAGLSLTAFPRSPEPSSPSRRPPPAELGLCPPGLGPRKGRPCGSRVSPGLRALALGQWPPRPVGAAHTKLINTWPRDFPEPHHPQTQG